MKIVVDFEQIERESRCEKIFAVKKIFYTTISSRKLKKNGRKVRDLNDIKHLQDTIFLGDRVDSWYNRTYEREPCHLHQADFSRE